jgi:protein TonB
MLRLDYLSCLDVVSRHEGNSMQSQQLHFVRDAELVAEAKAHIILPPPKVALLHEVFAETMLEDTSVHQRRSPLDWLLAIGIHFTILALLLILPLYFTTRLNFQRLNLTFLAAPEMHLVAPHLAPTPPPAAPQPARMMSAHAFTPRQLAAPTFIPKAVATAPASAGAPPDEALMGVSGGIPGGQIGGVLGGVVGGFSNAASPSAPVVARSKTPVLVGAIVKPPRLIFAPEPVYPLLARQTHISGVVVIEAVIDEQGKVTGMRVISGYPLLIPAALSAVSKRRYEPTILEGEPMPIDLRVEINFSFT